ncbi:MAG: rhodanese-like domain-containing protein [Bacteroidia bacterium]|nr:rhodanese-like domain-containing protein [Bacteroidia bacterium]
MLKFIKSLFAKNYEDLSGRDFRSRFESSGNAVLLDVRSPGEFSSGSIRGAKNINVMSQGFNTEVSKLDKSKEYFVFCRSGARSANACRIMSGAGLKVVNLKGGIQEWPQRAS